ncbi:nucleotide-binding alpha-beta plait domain-containing protein [Tanacetum coccineum]
MGSYKTKEDDVARISTSVYITNFPEMLSAKELFHACNQYGHVVDSFIPTKKSKNGKRFGFVRFINVFNEERLVNNLCTVWIDRYKIHANIARFQRPDAKKEGTGVKKSYAFPLPNEHLKTNVKAGEGRVKEFASLANLKLALGNEGFVDITIKYIGELWVMLEFNSEESKNKFNDNVSVASWFSQIIEASTDFEIEGRIAWVEVEGKSINEEFKIIYHGKTYWIRANETPGWVPDFTDEVDDEDHDEINSMAEEDEVQKSGGMDENSDGKDVPETTFEDEELVKKFAVGDTSDKKGDKSEDPLNIYSLLNRNNPVEKNVKVSDSSLQYPPGFSPIVGTTVNSDSDVDDRVQNSEEMKAGNKEEDNDAYSECRANNNSKGNGNESFSSGHFKKSEVPRIGGSIIGLLEEVVKVGQVMGYKMEGCISNMDEIIRSQGVEDGYR